MGLGRIVAGNQSLSRNLTQRNFDTPEAPDTGGFTSGDAIKAIRTQQGSATRLLGAGQGQFTAREQAQLEQIAERGFVEQAGSGLATLFNFLDRPRKLAALAIRDLTGFDERRNVEIEGGDYLSALKGENEALAERLGDDVVGEGGNLGFSQLLDDVWTLDDKTPFWAKTLRFGASLGGDIFTDPLSYLTFGASGVGKKAAMEGSEFVLRRTAARTATRLADDLGATMSSGIRDVAGDLVQDSAATALERSMLANARTRVDDILDELLAPVREAGVKGDALEQATQDLTEQAIREAVGIDEAAEIVGRSVDDLGPAGEILTEIQKRQATRTFGFGREGFDDDVWREFNEHVVTRRGGERLGPTYTLGGARLAIPFAVGNSTRPILQGAGKSFREAVGSQITRSKTASRFSERMQGWATRLDAKRPAILAAKEGEVVAYNQIRNQADNAAIAFGHTGQAGIQGMEDLDSVLRSTKGSHADKLAMREQAHRAIISAVESGGHFDSALMRELPEAVQASVREAMPKVKAGLDDAWAELSRRIPGLKKIDGHIPMYMNQKFVRDMRDMLDKNKHIALPDTTEAAEKLARELGVTVEDMTRFVEVQNTLMPQLRKGARPGTTGEFRKRTTGATAKGVDAVELFGDESVRIGDDLIMLNPALQSVNEVNDSLMRVYTALVEKRGLPYTPKKVKSALVLDPGEQIATYVTAVQGAAVERAMIDAARNWRLIRETPRVELVEAVARQVSEQVQPQVAKYYDLLTRRVSEGLEAVESEIISTKRVPVGAGVHVEIPETVLSAPRVRQALERTREHLRKVDRIKGKAATDRGRAASQLSRDVPSLTQKEAEQIVSLSSSALSDLRHTVMVETEQQVQELHRALDQIIAIESASQDVLDSALPTREAMQRLRAQTVEQLGVMEQQWDEAYRTVTGSSPDISLTRYADDGSVDVVQTRNLMSSAIFSPVKDGIQESVAIRNVALEDEAAELLERARQVDGPMDEEIQRRLFDIDIERTFNEDLAAGRLEFADLDDAVSQRVANAKAAEGVKFRLQYGQLVDIGQAFLKEQADQLGRSGSRVADRGMAAWRAWVDGGMDIMDPMLDDPDIVRLAAIGEAFAAGREDLLDYSNQLRRLGDERKVLDELYNVFDKDVSFLAKAQNHIDQMRGNYTRWTQETIHDMKVSYGATARSTAAGSAPLAALAQIYDDPAAFDIVVQNIDELNAIVRRFVRSDASLDITMGSKGIQVDLLLDGAREATTKINSEVPSLRQMANAFDAGDIPVSQLEDTETLVVQVFSDLRRQMTAEGRNVGGARRASTKQWKAIAEVDEIATEFDKIITDVVTGRSPASRLKSWAYEFDSRGKAIPTAKLKKLESFLNRSSTSVVGLRRAIDSAILSDETASHVAKRVLARNEAQWAENALKPLQKSINDLDRIIKDVDTARRATESESLKETLGRADEFIRELSGLNEVLAAQTDSAGRAVGGGVRAVSLEQTDLASRRAATRKAAASLNTASKAERDLVKQIKEGLKPSQFTRIDNPPVGFQTAEAFGLEGLLEGEVVDQYLGLMFENMLATTKALHTPWGMQQLQDSSRELVRWWKSAATVSKPTFHFRNLISGVANGTLVGVGPKNYARIGQPLNRFRRLLGDGAHPDEAFAALSDQFGKRTGEMFEAAWNNGVFQGFARTEGISGGRPFRSAFTNANVFSADNAMFRGGGKMMETFEDFLRMAAFDRHYAGAGSERLAAQMVIAVHFDYQHLTMLEKKFKTFAPFFVWTRRNLPLQLQMLMERPGMINVWNHLQRAGEQGDDPLGDFPLSPFASPLATRMGTASNEESPFWARMIWDPDLPVRILDDVPLFAKDNPTGFVPFKIGSLPEWFNWSSELFGPQFSVPMSVMQQEEWGDVEAPRGISELITAIDGLVDTDLIDSSSGTGKIPRWLRSVTETALPFYSEYRRWLGFQPADPNRLAREGFLPDDGEPLADLVRGDVGSFLENAGLTAGRGLGLGFQTPLDTKSAAFDAQDIVSEIRGRLSDMPSAP